MPGCLPLVELPSETGFEKEIALLGIFDFTPKIFLGCAPLATSLTSSHLNLKCVHLLVTPVYSVYIVYGACFGCAHLFKFEIYLNFIWFCAFLSCEIMGITLYIIKMYIVCMLLTWLWELTTTEKNGTK